MASPFPGHQALIDSMKGDQRTLETLWQRLQPALLKIAAGEPQPLLAGDVDPLVALYAQHMAREKAELLPMAVRLVSERAVASVGREMRERRGIA